ncbi:MAG: hypothetical protein V1492_05790 [Candidatus Micrarchaeota archaeon]
MYSWCLPIGGGSGGNLLLPDPPQRRPLQGLCQIIFSFLSYFFAVAPSVCPIAKEEKLQVLLKRKQSQPEKIYKWLVGNRAAQKKDNNLGDSPCSMERQNI